jgi:hypothetical protein
VTEQIVEKKVGFWASNKYYRLNVGDIEEFCGWRNLDELIQSAGSLRNKAFLTTLFLTGGRVKEVLSLKTENFMVRQTEGVVIVRDMMLEKRYKKVKEILDETGKRRWITEKISAKRKLFPIIIAEPLSPILIEWLGQTKEWLFPSPYKDSAPLSRFWAYKLVRRLDLRIPEELRISLGLNKPFMVNDVQVKARIHLWLHWFRSQRASQLVRDYGFEIIDLLKYFSWEKYETALHYAQKGWKDLAAKMKAAPTVYT